MCLLQVAGLLTAVIVMIAILIVGKLLEPLQKVMLYSHDMLSPEIMQMIH